MYVSVTVDIGDVERGLAGMERRGHALGPAFAELKKPMRADQIEHRKAKAGPESTWAPRAASTLAVKRGKHKLPRSILGRLPTAVSYKASATSVTAESRVAWSAIHEEGGVAGHGARIPARTFLWISDKLMTLAESVLERALLAAFGST